MKQIGGFFTYEPLPETENHFLEGLCPKDGSLGYFMSGRCANYYVLEDIGLTDTRKTAYVPVYTCETVLAPFLKAGYRLLFYDVTKDMTPVFDEAVLDRVSVINLCGYYGFCNYDREFIKKCSGQGIVILEDATHSIFSGDGIDPYCDYVVGSMRKWIGVPAGGFAIKRKGAFSLPVRQPDETHLSMRRISMKGKTELTARQDGWTLTARQDGLTLTARQDGRTDSGDTQKPSDTFWEAEMMLRRIFDSYGSDPESRYIIRHYDFDRLKERRRANYRCLLEHMPAHPALTPVFPYLSDCAVPSHFTVYAKDRDMVQKYMAGQGIKTTAYWPQGPMVDTTGRQDAAYIYSHVLSFPCDQRYGEEEMNYICGKIKEMPE